MNLARMVSNGSLLAGGWREVILALAVLEDLRDFVRCVRAGDVIGGELQESVAQWFGIERATTPTGEILRLKPTERFFALLVAAQAGEVEGELVERAAWAQRADGIYHGDVRVFPAEIVEQIHEAKPGDTGEAT